MPTRFPSLRRPPIGFAHRGGQADAQANTLAAFLQALSAGATGLESDVWVTRDGVPVLDHGGVVGRLRRKPIGAVDRAELPSHIPTLAELYETCGHDFELSLDVKQGGNDGTAAATEVLSVARECGGADAVERLWLCHHDLEVVGSWREAFGAGPHLVDSTRLRRISEGPERRAARLSALGVDAINMHHTDWNGGLVTLFHRFDILTFGWDAQFERILAGLLNIGIDAVYSDHVDRMLAALDAAT